MSNNDSCILGSIAKNVSLPSQRQIMRYYLQSQARSLLPKERVAQCHRALVPMMQRVKIMHDPDTKRAFYRNLIVCARVWQCPVCAARITEERRKEIQQGMDNIVERSVLITYTLQHDKSDDLTTILQAELDAYRSMKQGRWWQDFQELFGWIGSIRALEVTYGKNGWHPHFHELAFVDPSLELYDFDRMEEILRARWIAMLQKQGRIANWDNGLTLKVTFEGVAEYVIKMGHDPVDETWSAAREIAKAPSKKTHKDGKTTLQLLLNFGNGDATAGRLFVEYIKAFRGKKQLHWSHGLREYMGIAGKTDEEIADKIPETSIVLAILTDEQWHVILRKDRRGELLEIAAKGDVEELWEWLFNLGVTLTVEKNATDLMWEKYEEKYGNKPQ